MDHEDATMASDWYYSRSGNKFGPLSSAELKTKADSGELRPDDLIWKVGMIEWKPARSAKGLITSLPATLPPLPTSLSDAEEDEELGEISQDGFLSRTRRAMIRSVLISVPLVGLGFYGYMKVTGQPVETALKTVVAASKSTVTKLASNTEPENKATGNEPALIESDEVATSEKSNAKGQDSSASSKVTEAGSQNQQNQEIVADGSGQTSDDALKDAFRNAVRQVVGAVVDTETLVKNDEIIDDKVLTYSAGFIKGYEEVQGSKKVKDGLHRIKIRAQVERKGVIAKLEAAKVTVKGLDGKGLFAKVVTQQEAESDANALLQKTLAELPNLLTAEVHGEPEYDAEKSEVVIQVKVAADQEAYNQYAKRLEEILKKVALSTDSAVLKADHNQIRDRQSGGMVNMGDDYLVVNDARALAGPKLDRGKTKSWCLWVCSSTSARFQTQRWNCYVLPGDPLKVFLPITMPEAKKEFSNYEGPLDMNLNLATFRANDSRTTLRLFLKDSQGNIVTEDERELTSDRPAYGSGITIGREPLLRTLALRDFNGTNFTGQITPSVNASRGEIDWPRETLNAYVAPFALYTDMYGGQTPRLGCTANRLVLFRLKLSKEELAKAKDVTCEITFKPDPNLTRP